MWIEWEWESGPVAWVHLIWTGRQQTCLFVTLTNGTQHRWVCEDKRLADAARAGGLAWADVVQLVRAAVGPGRKAWLTRWGIG